MRKYLIFSLLVVSFHFFTLTVLPFNNLVSFLFLILLEVGKSLVLWIIDCILSFFKLILFALYILVSFHSSLTWSLHALTKWPMDRNKIAQGKHRKCEQCKNARNKKVNKKYISSSMEVSGQLKRDNLKEKEKWISAKY